MERLTNRATELLDELHDVLSDMADRLHALSEEDGT